MGLRSVVSKRLGLLAAGAALVLGMLAVTEPAEARSRHRHYSKHRVHATWRVKRYVHVRKRHYARPRHVAVVQMPAEFVVDANSGRVLHAHNENAERHPASLTKVMTLYLLFEQMEAGRIKLDTEIPISAHAAAQAPSKLGLRPGSTIEVDDAIKAVVTKSANDIAVAIAEAVGGSEDRFAEMMTRKAKALGMSRATIYRRIERLGGKEALVDPDGGNGATAAAYDGIRQAVVALRQGVEEEAAHAGRLVITGTSSQGFAFHHADGTPYGAPSLHAEHAALAQRAFAALTHMGFKSRHAQHLIATVQARGAPTDLPTFIAEALRAS